MTKGTRLLPIGGHHVTAALAHSIEQRGARLSKGIKDMNPHAMKDLVTAACCHSLSLDPVRTFKEALCYVALNVEEETKKYESEKAKEMMCEFKSCDGEIYQLDKERFQCAELFFQSSKNLPQLIVESIQACESEIQNELWSNIVLVGGASMMKGIEERLKKELMALISSSSTPTKTAPETASTTSSTTSNRAPRVRIIAPNEDRSLLAWRGAAMLAKSKYGETIWLKFDFFLFRLLLCTCFVAPGALFAHVYAPLFVFLCPTFSLHCALRSFFFLYMCVDRREEFKKRGPQIVSKCVL